MRKYFIFTLWFVLAVTFPLYAQPVAALPPGMVAYHSEKYGLTLTYPDTWRLDEKPETYDVPCILNAPVEKDLAGANGPDPFGAFIIPVFVGEGYFENLNALVTAWKDKFKGDWSEVELAGESTKETIQGFPAYEVRYVVSDEKDNRIQWSVWLVLTPEKKKAWVIGYCGRKGFETHLTEVRAIFDSAEFVD